MHTKYFLKNLLVSKINTLFLSNFKFLSLKNLFNMVIFFGDLIFCYFTKNRLKKIKTEKKIGLK